MNAAEQHAISKALAGIVVRTLALSGGDINDAYQVELDDGRRVFAKVNSSAAPSMFSAEARGLGWLAQANAIQIPRVLAASPVDGSEPNFLVLELLEAGRPEPGFDDRLGQRLAALHRFGAPSFGLDHDNFIGPLPQSNRECRTWAEFYGEERLLAQGKRAVELGRAGTALMTKLERLVQRLSQVAGPETQARLHGDLWGGNLHVTSDGEPALIDPAAYGGHREVNLAMMRLFGGFGARVFSAYAEAYPLAPGHDERVPLYQLYPLLVHLNLFGQGYLSAVESAIARYT